VATDDAGVTAKEALEEAWVPNPCTKAGTAVAAPARDDGHCISAAAREAPVSVVTTPMTT
jgi:hypothetical protein